MRSRCNLTKVNIIGPASAGLLFVVKIQYLKRWNLYLYMTTHPLRTFLPVVLLVIFGPCAYAQPEAIMINITAPGNKQVVDSNMAVQAVVTSDYAVSTHR